MLLSNTNEKLAEFYGFPLETRPAKCYPRHFDPISIYFDTELTSKIVERERG